MPNLPFGGENIAHSPGRRRSIPASPVESIWLCLRRGGLHNRPMRGIHHLRAVVPLLALALNLQGCEPELQPPAAAYGDMPAVPAAPGSQSPNLAGGSGKTLALSWLEPDGNGHVLRYSTWRDSQWTAPRDVARGDNWFVNWADFPSVVPISESLWGAHWLVQQPAGGYAYDVLFSISTDGGSTWPDGVIPHDDQTPTEHGFVTLFPQGGGVGLVWLDGRNMAQDQPSDAPLAGMTLRSATYSSGMNADSRYLVDELVCDCCQTDVAITSAGPIGVYRNRTPDETRDIYTARFEGGEWRSGRPVANDGWTIGGCPVNGPVIAAENERVAVAWFTAANDEPKVRIARSRNSGDSYSAPVDIANGDTFGRVGLAMLPGDDLAVSWLCRKPDNTAQVCLRRVFADDRLGPVRVLSEDDEISPLSVPQLARSGDYVVAAWTAREDGGTRIRSRRIPLESLLQAP